MRSPLHETKSQGEDAASGQHILSQEKLRVFASSLEPWVQSCRCIPCETDEVCFSYRCRCSFQIVHGDMKSDGHLRYAVRQNHEPVCITAFPVANLRIQRSMWNVLALFNDPEEQFGQLKQSLTSATFSTSWDETMCVVTLHYMNPVSDESAWETEAQNMCQRLELAQLTGRSRKRILRTRNEGTTIICDTIWMERVGSNWNVSLEKTLTSSDRIAVHYNKPEDAFYHPNSRAMCNALEWMLSRIVLIVADLETLTPRLLEMYCGCGAHTIPLAKTGLLSKILAIELDERLVRACQQNILLNGIDSELIDMVSQDAGKWSQRCKSSFDILLVDPPRQGLDESVCKMATGGDFQHMLYISCGRDALVRDLERLGGSFAVENCTLLDLFPTTGAVESLVHLKRKIL